MQSKKVNLFIGVFLRLLISACNIRKEFNLQKKNVYGKMMINFIRTYCGNKHIVVIVIDAFEIA